LGGFICVLEEETLKIKDVLVPVDFSPTSTRALEFASSLVDSAGEIYLLHVIDSDFVARVDEAGFDAAESAIERLRKRAELRMQELVRQRASEGPNIQTMIVVGKPFSEILRVATDLDFEMIVLGTHGRPQKDFEELLFGSTAEKVLRATRIPIVFVPGVWTPRA
jgi:nucleotide-binding universal stress UspA family protein